MPIYLDVDCDEARATTHGVMAAIEGFIGRLLCGPRQHEAHSAPQRRPALRVSIGESRNEGVQR